MSNTDNVCNILKYKHSLVSLFTCVDPIGCWQNIPSVQCTGKMRATTVSAVGHT